MVICDCETFGVTDVGGYEEILSRALHRPKRASGFMGYFHFSDVSKFFPLHFLYRLQKKDFTLNGKPVRYSGIYNHPKLVPRISEPHMVGTGPSCLLD